MRWKVRLGWLMQAWRELVSYNVLFDTVPGTGLVERRFRQCHAGAGRLLRTVALVFDYMATVPLLSPYKKSSVSFRRYKTRSEPGTFDVFSPFLFFLSNRLFVDYFFRALPFDKQGITMWPAIFKDRSRLPFK
jgi:hypothetical protein